MRRSGVWGVVIVGILIGAFAVGGWSLPFDEQGRPAVSELSPTPSPTDTSAERQLTVTATERQFDIEFPRGVSSNGLVNSTALIASHRNSLLSEGYVDQLRVKVIEYGSGRNSTFMKHAIVATGKSGYHIHTNQLTAGAVDWRRELWSNQSLTLVRVDRFSNSWRYSEGNYRTAFSDLANAAVLTHQLTLGNFSRVGVSKTANQTLIELEASSYRPTVRTAPPPSAVSLYQSTVTVDQTGRIRTLRSQLRIGNRTVIVTYELTDYGIESVDRPSWIKKAIRIITSDEDPAPV